jgi:methyl-accepting chemotaxis protein
MAGLLSRHTSMRGRLALMLIACMVGPITIVGLLGYGWLIRVEQQTATDLRSGSLATGVQYRLNAAVTGFVRCLDGALRDLELRAVRAAALSGPDLLTAFDDLPESSRPTAVIEVAADGTCQPPLATERLEILRGVLLPARSRAGLAVLPVDGLRGSSLFQVVIEPRHEGGCLLVLRDLAAASGEGLLASLPFQEGVSRLLTLGERAIASTHGSQPVEAVAAADGRPQAHPDPGLALWQQALSADAPDVLQEITEERLLAASVLRDLAGAPVGLAVVTASEVDLFPLIRRVGALASQLLSLIGCIALAGVLASVVIGMAAPRFVWRNLRQSTETIFGAVERLRELVRRSSRAWDEQTALVLGIQGSVGALRQASQNIADSARSLAHSADQSAWVSQSGNQKAELAQRSVLDVRERVTELSDQMEELDRRCGEIGSILDFIDHLSKETNTLSINATIQAAGSGSSGRQFSVVAGEIRKLADMALDSTRDIHQLVEQIQSSSRTTLDTTQEGSLEVDRALSSFEELESAFARILRWVEETTQSAQAIERSTASQSDALEAVVDSIEQLQDRSRETADNSHEVVVAADDLAALGRQMTETWRVG